MIEAYFDESGIHDGAVVCVVAGYYGSQPLWRKFEAQWERIIGDYPELAGVGFHAKRFFARANGKRVSPYTEWSDEKAEKFLERLVQCVIRNAISPIGYGVVVKDFLALPLIERKWFTGAKFTTTGKAISSGCPDKPYYLPFQYCVLHSARMSGGTIIEKVHFFAGLDRNFHEYASTLFGYLLTDARLPASLLRMLGTIASPLAKDTPGLQAADLLANRLYQHAFRIVREGRELPPSQLLQNLTKNRRDNQPFILFNKRALQEIQDFGRREYAKLLAGGERQLQAYLERLKEK